MGSTYFSKRVPTRTYRRTQRSRPKSFKTESKAKEWAEKNKVTSYTIKQLNPNKFCVIQNT